MSDLENILLDKHGIQIIDEGYKWQISGYERKGETGDEINIHFLDLEKLSCEQMVEILDFAKSQEIPDCLIVISEYFLPDQDIEYIPYHESLVKLISEEGKLQVLFNCQIESNTEIDLSFLKQRVSPLTSRKNLTITSSEEPVYDYSGSVIFPDVQMATQNKDYLCTDLIKDAFAVQALCKASGEYGLTPEHFMDLVRAQQAEALLGQTENQWIEVKSEHFYLDSPQGKYRFLESIVQFANSDDGGVLLLGAMTESAEGKDYIEKITPLPITEETFKRKQQYKSLVLDFVFPPIKNLVMEEIKIEKEELVMFHVPQQPEYLKPFLIHGKEEGKKIKKQYIAFVERNGDSTYTYTPESIHSMLAAGRAIFRRFDNE